MIRAKKSLGQNFLKDKKTLKLITQKSLEVQPLVIPRGWTSSDLVSVLEVGPGKGALTACLLDAGLTVYAIEKDHRLIETLQDKFTQEIEKGQFNLIEGDALECDPESILRNRVSKFQVVANLPYYITGLYLRQTLEYSVRPEAITLMLQKEVVDRIVARDGKESLLSISVKAFGTPSKLCNVSAKHFSPAPKVDSAVLHISDISDQRFKDADISIEQFFTIVRAGFSSKRKMLKNNLQILTKEKGVSFEQVAHAIQKPLTVRAEVLSINDWFIVAGSFTRSMEPNS